jgi:hypothetical protein
MTSYISAELRREVRGRAAGRCEYCLVHEDDTYYGCEVDHIIAEKHGGLTELQNLAYACFYCNRAKGTDLGSIAIETGALTPFFNPRSDNWNSHFYVNGLSILGKTPSGEVTARILRFNDSDRIEERDLLMAFGRFPPSQT